MKIGIAKFNAGIPPKGNKISPVKPIKITVGKKEVVSKEILKGKEYYLPDTYEFTDTGIFEEKKTRKEK